MNTVLEIRYLPWTQDHQTREDDDQDTMVVQEVYFDGRRIPFVRPLKGEYVQDSPRFTLEVDAFVVAHLKNVDPAFFYSLTPDQYAMGSTPFDIRLIVGSIDVKVLQPA